MTDYVFGADIKGNCNLIAHKLRDDNSNIRMCCVACETKDMHQLYEINYDVSELSYINYGIYCKDCAKKIFRFGEDGDIE